MSAHWTRKITFEGDANDWIVPRDGPVAGRLYTDEALNGLSVTKQLRFNIRPNHIRASSSELKALN
ncbi:hypothetical protein EOJ32_09840 [Paracoccus sp. Arc7-R13]|uniref:hypothetical protein n=1 Tax=Paracoccus sp. Arc7-R13 TaxID=2500532 RepID=UPI000FD8356A|nr:hypothetical protein [Paracoccus sp. Arc7-R13]AZY93933.1 hypothetical protein EOJ32_09840 [Paracoccus sp. Arc7-R13]